MSIEPLRLLRTTHPHLTEHALLCHDLSSLSTAVVPNLPFFYLVYRAWSHWKGKPLTHMSLVSEFRLSDTLHVLPLPLTAYKSSQYLSTLIASNLVRPTESKELDSIFAQTTSPRLEASSEKTSDAATLPMEDERMLLLQHHIPLLMEKMEFPEWVRADLRRARLQVEKGAAENKLDQLESSAENVHPENNK